MDPREPSRPSVMPVIYPNDAAQAVPMATSITLGWFVGASMFILVFALTKIIAVALAAALFFGVIFGFGIYYVLKYRR